MKKIFIFLVLLVSGAVQAAPVIIDFEGIVGPGQYLDFPTDEPYVEDNFALSQAGSQAGFVSNTFFQNESSALIWCAVACDGGPNSITLEHDGQSLFNLHGLQAGDVNDPGLLLVEGRLAGGELISVSIGVDWPDITDYQFSSEWVNLQSVTFSGIDSSVWIDNIVVTAVPIPAAVWLLGSALAGLGLVRRKQTV